MVYTEHMRSDPAYRERLRACGLDSVRNVLARVEGRVAAWSRTTDTLYVPGADGGPGFYVKRHYFPHWSNRLRGTLRGRFFGQHKGQLEYGALNALRLAGVPTVRAVAYGDRRLAHFVTACFLITEEVPQAQNLTTFALDVAGGRREVTHTQRRLMIRTLAVQLAEMHAAGISHGNLFWRNVLVRNGVDERPEFFFLDAQPMRKWERLGAGSNWWLRELAQVTVSALQFTTRTERLRFIRDYAGAVKLTPEGKVQVRQIARLAATWQSHEERRIRMNNLFETWNRNLAEETRQTQRGDEAEPLAEQLA